MQHLRLHAYWWFTSGTAHSHTIAVVTDGAAILSRLRVEGLAVHEFGLPPSTVHILEDYRSCGAICRADVRLQVCSICVQQKPTFTGHLYFTVVLELALQQGMLVTIHFIATSLSVYIDIVQATSME